MTHATVSEHIRAPRAAGLVEFKIRGTSHEYSLVPDRLDPIDRWIRTYRKIS